MPLDSIEWIRLRVLEEELHNIKNKIDSEENLFGQNLSYLKDLYSVEVYLKDVIESLKKNNGWYGKS